MKIGTDSSFHLTYCTNIHPGETWRQVFANLQQYVPALKARLSPKDKFGIGLRLADIAARELLAGDTLAQFQAWLTQQDLYVFTLNGFPYGGFHQQVVKDQVYAPDWSQRSRLDYTVRLAKILATLLPEGMDGGISTLPLSYKPWWKDIASWKSVFKIASSHLALVTAELIRLQAETGKLLHVDLEPEPDGLLENATEVVEFFQTWLLPVGGAWLAGHLGISRASAEAKLLEHVRICYDTCHFAVEYEDPASVFARFEAAGLRLGKIQISAAIQVALPTQLAERISVLQRLQPFAESTYLHQVIERRVDGTLHHYSDLETALPHLLKQPLAQEWRTHFHVPIFIHDYQILQSTQADIVTVLDLLRDNPLCYHLEIETYTWDVLPDMKLDLLTSIQREYDWVLARMTSRRSQSLRQPEEMTHA